MKNLAIKPPKVIYLSLIFSLIILGCDPDSSGSKETQQIDNDEDPTAIERPRGQDPLLPTSENSLDDQGEFVVIEDFNEENWQKLSQEYNLGNIQDSTRNRINSEKVGAEAWKSWDVYQYRVVYFVKDGDLKAKPILKNKSNEEIDFTARNIDSLNMNELWTEINRNTSVIANNYKSDMN